MENQLCRAFVNGKVVAVASKEATVAVCTTRLQFARGFYPVDARLVDSNPFLMRVFIHLALLPTHPPTHAYLPNSLEPVILKLPRPTLTVSSTVKTGRDILFVDATTDRLVYKIARVLGCCDREAEALQMSFDGVQCDEEGVSLTMATDGETRLSLLEYKAKAVELDAADNSFAAWSNVVAMARLRIGGVRIAVFDMDSTLVDAEGIDMMAALAGVEDKVKALTAQAMGGELDFASAFRERLNLLKGLSTQQLARIAMPLNPGVTEAVTELQQRGAIVGLVSGGFQNFAKDVEKKLELQFAVANVAEIEAGRLTGRHTQPIITSQHKLQVYLEVLRASGVPWALTVAVGDGSNDIPMLQAAAMGTSFRGKPKVKKATDVHVNRQDMMHLLRLVPVPCVDHDVMA
ncbi:MAG: uncharacterized protein KVP18_004374 [Porospora cf. gigantea A]|uniref:uncharacterized protein n=1 Tax=Porospora cf. gigantea A TaxID=2853593 RepID=UPI003559D2A5|nr:MAG: hypothetical protein KVP18_004374 [Porospora cf. gigantea A]